MDQLDPVYRLGLALAIGLLIGVERGWHERAEPEGARVAGLRTFGLVGFLGGLWALLADILGELLLGVGFAAVAAVIVVARLRATAARPDYGVTTVVAAMITFVLGALAVAGDVVIAAGGAVVTAVLLGIKPELHRWLTLIEHDELLAGLKLGVMSLVLLPLLPDRGFGPWQVLNPYEIWLMVILIAGISFVGYAAVKIAGDRRGVLLTALAGGLISSTSVALTLARLAGRSAAQDRLLAAGIALASLTMFPRTVLIAALIAPALAPHLAWPLGLAVAAGLLGAAVLWRRAEPAEPAESTSTLTPRNPLQLTMALKFGALLVAIILFTRAMLTWLGEVGIYVAAAIGGVSDVDAITLSLARMTDDAGMLPVAATGIVLAAIANTLVKNAIAAGIGGRRLGGLLLLTLGPSMLAAMAGLVFTPFA